MKKDAFYFPHDSNAKDDPKCIMLIEQLGLEGYGIYWVLIETLRDQPGYCYPVQLLPALARRFNTTYEKIKTVVYNYNLFSIKDEVLFFSESLINRMHVIDERREKQRIKAFKRWGNDAAALPKHSHGNAELMPVKKRKEKKRKEKEIIENITPEILNLIEYSKNYFDSKYITEKATKCFIDLIKIDNYTANQIKKAILLGRSDPFWEKNFLSPVKLRDSDKNGVKYIDKFLNIKSNEGNKINERSKLPTRHEI